MIKVNLLKNAGKGGGGLDGKTVTKTMFDLTQVDGGGGGGSSLGIILKLLLILAIPGGLVYFEKESLKDKRLRLNKMRAELATTEKEQAGLASVEEVVKQYTIEKEKIENQMELARSLNKVRLREIKSLDAIQNLIPKKVWLSKLAIDKGKMQITGYSINSEDISRLTSSMEDSVYFSEVVLSSSTEEQSTKGTFKKFELGCKMETL